MRYLYELRESDMDEKVSSLILDTCLDSLKPLNAYPEIQAERCLSTYLS